MNEKKWPEDVCDLVLQARKDEVALDSAEDLLERARSAHPDDERVVDLVIGYSITVSETGYPPTYDVQIETDSPYYPSRGNIYGYYHLIWRALDECKYKEAFRYCRRVVELRPRMGSVLLQENGARAIDRSVYCAAKEKDWGACRVILDTALEWDSLSKERIGGIYLKYAFLAGLHGEFGSYAKSFIERAELLLGSAKDEDVLGATWSYDHVVKFSVEDYFYSDQGCGRGYLGLAMLAMKENQIGIASLFANKGLEILERNPHLQGIRSVWEIAWVADMKDMSEIACKYMALLLKAHKTRAFSIAGNECSRLAKKCGLE